MPYSDRRGALLERLDLPESGVANRPIAILVGGAPGAGKTTLASLLGARLRLPVLSKDVLRQSTLWSLGHANVKAAPWGPGLWYPAVETLLLCGISVIGDMTLLRGVSETEVAEQIAPLSRLLQIHCRSRFAPQRFRARTLADPLRGGDLESLVAEAAPLFGELWEPLELDCPCLVVDTDGDYKPSLDELVAEVVERFAPHLKVLATRGYLPGPG
jgi:predicted kinase